MHDAPHMLSDDGELLVATRTGTPNRVAAVGDMDFTAKTYFALKEKGPGHIFGAVRHLLARSDARIGNLESVLVAHPYTRLGRQAYLIGDLDALAAMRDAGFDAVTLANNHIMDGGPEALQECLAALREGGVQYTGAGPDLATARTPARLTVGELALRIHSYTYDMGELAGPQRAGCLDGRLEVIRKDLADFHRDGDIVFVSLHMDAEFQPGPSPERVALCRGLVDSGVHVVLCHHPHVLQGLEAYRGSLIAYGLGNFVTTIEDYLLRPSAVTHLSAILEIDLDREGVRGARVHPVVMDAEGRPVPATEEASREIIRLLQARSALLHRPEELARLYREMVREYGREFMKSIYWATGERNWSLLKHQLVAASRPVKRRWLRDFAMSWLAWK